MFSPISKILLWLFVLNLGIAFGAGLYEWRIEFPLWLSTSADSSLQWNAEAARQANTGLNFWVYVTTVPLTLLTLANLMVAWRSQGTGRGWWVGAAVVVLVERVMTFSYFIPTMVKLQSSGLPELEAVAAAIQWEQLGYLRHTLTLAGWLATLKAFRCGRSILSAPGWPRRATARRLSQN
jgi:hypothetical protein